MKRSLGIWFFEEISGLSSWCCWVSVNQVSANSLVQLMVSGYSWQFGCSCDTGLRISLAVFLSLLSFSCDPCICVWLHRVFAARGSSGLLSAGGVRAPRCGGLLAAERGLWCVGFSARGSRALWCVGSVAPPHGGLPGIRDPSSVSCIGGWLPYYWATRKAPLLCNSERFCRLLLLL